MLRIDDADRIRTITLDRPDALNAFNEALYDATADALIDAAADNDVAVVVITGTGRAFSAGTDVVEMAQRNTEAGLENGRHGFPGLIDQLVAFPKPLVCAVNGLALGIGATILGFADLAFVSTDARIRCPFTALGVAPEAASSYTFPNLIGHQRAFWVLTSSEWFSAQDCVDYGLALAVCEPNALLDETMRHARVLAAKPLASLVECKRTMVATRHEAVRAGREREDNAFQRLLGGPANREAFVALFEKRDPDFASVDAAHPVDVALHARD